MATNAQQAKEDKHLADTVKPRKGFYRKQGDGQTKDYAKEWESSGKRGYGELLYQVHHVIPEDSIYNKALYTIGDEAQRKYIKTCLLRSEWNINDYDNLIGLPDLYSFLIYFDRKRAGKANEKVDNTSDKGGKDGGYIMRKIKALNDRTKSKSFIDVPGLLGKAGDASTSPEKYPVHLPVSWGHTKYNYTVADDVKSDVMNAVDEGKDHAVEFVDVASTLNAIRDDYRQKLIDDATEATFDTWEKRHSGVEESEWRPPFLMDEASSTLLKAKVTKKKKTSKKK